MTTPTRRRWFRFSLRTFFVVVAIFSAWFAWQVRVVRERKAVVEWLDNHKEWASYARTSAIDGWSRLLGETTRPIAVLYPTNATQAEINRVQAAFPEMRLDPWPHLDMEAK